MSTSGSTTKIELPPGVTIGAGRETSQTNAQGQIVQGTTFPLTTPGGTTTSVFVPHSDLSDLAKVQSLIDARVKAIIAISG